MMFTASRASDSELARQEIFFAELDVVDAGAGGFGDFFEEAATAGGFVSGEGGAVGDVVEEAAFRHQLSAISDMGRTGAKAPIIL